MYNTDMNTFHRLYEELGEVLVGSLVILYVLWALGII